MIKEKIMNKNKGIELPEEFIHSPADMNTVNELMRRNNKKIPKTIKDNIRATGNLGYPIGAPKPISGNKDTDEKPVVSN